MFSGRLVNPVAALLAGCVVAGSAYAASDGPPSQLMPIRVASNPEPVPEDVKLAVAALQQACANWRRTYQPAPTLSGPVPLPASDPRPPLPDRGRCDAVEDPEHAMDSLLWLTGWLGAMAMVLALAVFCAVRGVLLSLWNWRLPIGARPW